PTSRCHGELRPPATLQSRPRSTQVLSPVPSHIRGRVAGALPWSGLSLRWRVQALRSYAGGGSRLSRRAVFLLPAFQGKDDKSDTSGRWAAGRAETTAIQCAD